MVRRLDDTHVGEYKSSWFLTIFSSMFMTVVMIFLFVSNIAYKEIRFIDGSDYKMDYIGYSPLEFLFNFGVKDCYGFFALFLITSVVFMFLNIFFKACNLSISKTIYIKIAKLIEIFLGIGCMYFNYQCMNFEGFEAIKIFIFWNNVIVVYLILAIIDYFMIKKISIYD